MIRLILFTTVLNFTSLGFAQEEQLLPPDSSEVVEKTSCIDPPPPKAPDPQPKFQIDTEEASSPIVEFPDVQSRFPGDKEAYQTYVAEHLHYPEESITSKEEGTVYLSFIVELDGSLSQIKVRRGVSPELDAEAVRFAQNMPNWNPGEMGGKKVRTLRHVPVVFKLTE